MAAIKVNIEYHLLNGKIIHKKREFVLPPPQGTFIKKPEKEFDGMFILEKITDEGKKFIVKQIDCDPIHWKGDENGLKHGIDEKCRKKCKYYENCFTSTEAMLCVDTCS